METWLTADYHLGEDRFELMGRSFGSPQAMIERLIYLHNVKVNPDDQVIIVGDVCYQKAPDLSQIKRFNGFKTLIRGNHDRVFTDSDLSKYFDRVIPEGEGLELEVEGIRCYATHYPTQGRADRFNLVGHIHGAWKYQLNMLNVGIDVHHYHPVNLKSIPFHYKAICEFYDNDVWVAYDKINAVYHGKRGKQGNYFTKPKPEPEMVQNGCGWAEPPLTEELPPSIKIDPPISPTITVEWNVPKVVLCEADKLPTSIKIDPPIPPQIKIDPDQKLIDAEFEQVNHFPWQFL